MSSKNKNMSEEKQNSESKKVARKNKDKFTDIGTQADARVSGTPVQMTDEEREKYLKQLQAVRELADAEASSGSSGAAQSTGANVPKCASGTEQCNKKCDCCPK